MIRFCQHCGASLSAEALYCGECGSRDRVAARERARARATERRALGRRGMAIATVVAGGFGGLVLAALLAPDSLLGAASVSFVVDLLTATAVLAMIGAGSWRVAMGRAPDARGLTLALPTAALTLALSWGYVRSLAALFGVTELLDSIDAPTGVPIWIVAVVFAPLAEEWLCRGALWITVRPVTGRRTAIVATAIVFGFLHGLNGLHVLEVPHRFAMGLALGWLRAQTGSLWPCVFAHALHNAAALALE